MSVLTGLLSGALAPLVDNVAEKSARLVKKAALFLIAFLCLNAVLIALTVAFFLWIASLRGSIVAALAVAGVYFVIAALAMTLALWGGAKSANAKKKTAASPYAAGDIPAAEAHPETAALIDRTLAPLIDLLQRSGLTRERIALQTGATLAKRAGPLPIVGAAILIGFLAGRFWKSMRHFADHTAAYVPMLAALLDQLQPETPPAPEA